ncbi:alpha/beta hydrolase [Massilia terrae]|uniref:Alpha/beta hydrolase n=1 Tax=Massilia terrae TaxID=1811224 RepID=A0ABT2CUT5_9BURK|nr:alpha/beta hydrolase [Massilia terrae]MCS0657366.1 alpha/beta hydrolase [Massilia terrae]
MKPVSLLFAAVMVVCAPAFAAEPEAAPNPYAFNAAAAEKFDVGALQVQRFGSGGRPLILIPGLGSGAWAFQDLVRSLSDKHAVYVVTLPGFDGRAPAEGNVMDASRSALRELIASHKLDKPVLVGHSLGGTLAIAVAEDAPQLVGGVVTLDGLPVFPGTEGIPAAMRPQAAQRMRAQLAAADPRQFEAQQVAYMRTVGVLDIGMADALGRLSARSDQGAFARAAADDFALDLRAGLPKITAPVLVVSPFFEADGAQLKMSETDKADYYKSLMDGTPKLEVVSISPSRHFVQFDQPEQLADTIKTFLTTL